MVSVILHFHDDGTVTCSGLSSSVEQTQTARAVETVQAAFPGAQVVDDPWAGIDAAPSVATTAPSWPAASSAPVPATPAPSAPVCAHGPRRYVPAGVSKSGPRAGQPYPAFWGCQAAREDPTKCTSIPVV